jgi:hypothetical protein
MKVLRLPWSTFKMADAEYLQKAGNTPPINIKSSYHLLVCPDTSPLVQPFIADDTNISNFLQQTETK